MNRNGLRRRVSEILDPRHGEDPPAEFIDRALVALIILNVAAVIVESMPETPSSWRPALRLFEIFSVCVFTIEYAARVWTAVENADARFRAPVSGRLKYMLTPMMVLDLLVILPFYLAAFAAVDLRILRVLRFVKLARYSSSMTLVLYVLRKEARPIGATLFLLSVLAVIAASLAYLFEQHAQPEQFGSIPRAMWWAVVTMTTIGYGDAYPVTAAGKIAGAVIGLAGVGIVALPAGILASGFNEALHTRREEYKNTAEQALSESGGAVNAQIEKQLEDARRRMGLGRKEARAIVRSLELPKSGAGAARACPHCGGALTPPPGPQRP